MFHRFARTTSHERLLLGSGVGLLVAFVPTPWSVGLQGLVAWVCGACTYLLLAWRLAAVFDAPRTKARAQSQDQPSVIWFSLLLLSVFASVAAISILLSNSRELEMAARVGHVAVALLALISSWLLMQCIFAFRYAHLYYQSELSGHPVGGGLQFPGALPPDYFDFLYYSHVVGMTSQVSDVVVTSRPMRHLTLIHSLAAFAFNMMVLALSINVMASML
jgi:uncharacterized membrane protein